MTVPFVCLLVVALLPFVIAGTGARMRVKQLGSLDAREPRVQALQLQGAARRAIDAQSNAWEALAIFTAAVAVAHLAGAAAGPSAVAAVVFVVARIGHAIFYVGDLPVARTAAFLTGLLCCLTLFGLGLAAG